MTQTVLTTAESRLCRLHFKKVKSRANLPALNRLFSELPFPFIFGGNLSKSQFGRFSCWTAEAAEIFEFSNIQKEPFEKLQRVLNKYRLVTVSEGDLPKGVFKGGWAGFFSYDLGRFIEKISLKAIDDLQLPLIRLGFYDKVLVYDHIEECFLLIAIELPGDRQKPDKKLDFLERLLGTAEEKVAPAPAAGDIENIDFSKFRCNMTRDYYLRSVERIKRHIFDGNVYQVNFSQRFECDFDRHPVELFNWQNQFNPSGYSAYIDADDFAVVSASPEMFITIADGFISTKPIKGTRPRAGGGESDINRENYEQLVLSEKEQAELNMIIDLERNDLARICIPGTRKVIQPRTVETYPTIYHAVATVAGRLGRDKSFPDILRGIFPGGSITGAPKIAAMEIIEQLEPVRRGLYTGCIGFIGLGGEACLNIAIRTVIIKNKRAFVQTGGGIVADSDGEAELEETLVKARALLAGIESVQKTA